MPPQASANGTKLTQPTQALTSVMSGAAVERKVSLSLPGIPTTSGYNPRPLDRCRAVVFGLRGNYKSSFCASNPDALVLDWEDGCSALMHSHAQIVPLNPPADADLPADWKALTPWTRYEKTKKALLEAARKGTPIKTIVLDTLDEMIEVITRKFCTDNGIESPGDYRDGRAGWYRIRDAFMAEYQELYNAGYGVWMPAHLRERTIKNGENETIVIEPWIADSIRKTLLKNVDQVLYIELFPRVQESMVNKVIAGKAVQVKEKTEKIVVHLRTLARRGEKEIKNRVLIPDGTELSLEQPWADALAAYNTEVERVRATQPPLQS